jgi:Protein tyrosine and serine/threonine kinase
VLLLCGSQVTQAADVYSVGIVLCLLFNSSNEAVWDSCRDPDDVMMDKMRGSYRLDMEGCEDEWAFMVECCTDANPESRPTVEHLGSKLRQLLWSLP